MFLILAFYFILSPNVVKANSSCGDGSIVGSPPATQIPWTDYGKDGLLQFHFKLEITSWYPQEFKVSGFDPSCTYTGGATQFSGGYLLLPKVKNILLKVIEASPSSYTFQTYNEDSGELLSNYRNLLILPRPILYSTIRLTLTANVYDGSGFRSDSISTPVMPVRKSVDQNKTPVLIVPGVVGTEIYKGTEKLWPDITRMLTDVGDQFMDPMMFKSDLTPLDNSLRSNSLVTEPFIGQHYYDLLLNEFKLHGFIQEKDLFTFPL